MQAYRRYFFRIQIMSNCIPLQLQKQYLEYIYIVEVNELHYDTYPFHSFIHSLNKLRQLHAFPRTSIWWFLHYEDNQKFYRSYVIASPCLSFCNAKPMHGHHMHGGCKLTYHGWPKHASHPLKQFLNSRTRVYQCSQPLGGVRV